MLEDPITDLSIAMEIDHFRSIVPSTSCRIVLKIPCRELALAKRGGAEHTLIDFVGEIKDLVSGDTELLARDDETGRSGAYPDNICHSNPEQSGKAYTDQLGRIKQPACRSAGCATMRKRRKTRGRKLR